MRSVVIPEVPFLSGRRSFPRSFRFRTRGGFASGCHSPSGDWWGYWGRDGWGLWWLQYVSALETSPLLPRRAGLNTRILAPLSWRSITTATRVSASTARFAVCQSTLKHPGDLTHVRAGRRCCSPARSSNSDQTSHRVGVDVAALDEAPTGTPIGCRHVRSPARRFGRRCVSCVIALGVPDSTAVRRCQVDLQEVVALPPLATISAASLNRSGGRHTTSIICPARCAAAIACWPRFQPARSLSTTKKT